MTKIDTDVTFLQMLQIFYVFLFSLRQTTSRQAGENGLYTCVGAEEFNGSPRSNNSGGISSQKLTYSALYSHSEDLPTYVTVMRHAGCLDSSLHFTDTQRCEKIFTFLQLMLFFVTLACFTSSNNC